SGPHVIGSRLAPGSERYAALIDIAFANVADSRTIAIPLSWGTLSHLWASVAHESASAMPSTRCFRRGLAAAHRPNAPSTCTHASMLWAASQISPIGSQAPLFTFPTCAQTITGPRSRGISHAFIRP